MRSIKLFCMLLLLLSIDYVSGQSNAIIAKPVSGSFLIAQREERLLLVDTLTGSANFVSLPAVWAYNPSWNSDGSQIVYANFRSDHTVVNVISGTITNIDTFPELAPDDFVNPYGWSANDSNILYRGSNSKYIGQERIITITFYLFDVSTQSLSEVGTSFIIDQLLPASVPLPAGITSAYLDMISNIRRNPVYDEWIALEMAITDQALLTDPNDPSTEQDGAGAVIIVLWNYATGEMLLVNDLVSERGLRSPTWSEDGRRFTVETPRNRIYTMDFVPGPGPSIAFEKHTNQQARIMAWLGVDDLLINFDASQRDTDYVFTIAQIIGNQWYQTEFFRLSRQDYPGAGVGGSDWRLTASEDEQHALSCLFDQAMPTHLSIGTRARVNFTDGTPLRLRTEPDFESTEITQMPEGTEFDVIGGPACVNSDFYYRFWQLELDDGTVGWAAEANNTDFFIELVVVDSEETATLATETTTPTGISAIAWSPDGSMIAVGRETDYCVEDSNVYTIEILDPFSRQVVQTLAGSTCDITAIDWSPDGTKLAAASLDDIGLRVWDVQSGELLALAQRGGQGVTSVRWRPDGLELAVGTVSNGIAIIDPITGETTGSPRIGGTSIDWNPDGSKLMSGGIYDNDVYIADMTTGQQIMVLSAHAEPIYSVDWSPDSGKIASASGDDTLRVWDATTGENLFTMNVPRIVYVRWNPDSQTIAIASYDNVAQIWDATKGELLDTFSYPRRVYAVDWSPDGTKLAYSGSRIDGQDGTLEIATLSQPATPAPETTP